MLKTFSVWTITNWKILKEMGVPDHLTCLLKSLYLGQNSTVRIRHRTTERFKTGKEARKGVHSHSSYLTSIQDTSFDMLDCINPKMESRLLGEISTSTE